MKRTKKQTTQCTSLVAGIALTALTAAPVFAGGQTIKIGVNLSDTGPLSSFVTDIRSGITLAKEEINQAGGLTIGGKKYEIVVLDYDNTFKKSKASSLTMQAIAKDKIIAMILPLLSDFAIQSAGIANSYKVPAVAVNTTSPKITKNRAYAFRTSASYDEMAGAAVELANKEWHAKKAAILYDELNGYCTDMAKTFKKQFTAAHGAQAITAVETFRHGDTSYKKQLEKIIASNPDFLYLPQYAEEIASVVKGLRAMGWNKPITGAHSWNSPDLTKKCGRDCNNLFFTANFIANGAVKGMKNFADLYQAKYKKAPTESAAFGYEAFRIITNALVQTGGLSGSIAKDRSKLRDAIAATNYDGATGKIAYKGSGEPVKCPLVVKIDNNGEFVKQFSYCRN